MGHVTQTLAVEEGREQNQHAGQPNQQEGLQKEGPQKELGSQHLDHRVIQTTTLTTV